jgi:hypothetical protein
MALLAYLAWQLLYFVKTEVVDKKKLDANPNLQTSLRWLSTDKKNGANRAILKLLKTVGVFAMDEDFDHTTMKVSMHVRVCLRICRVYVPLL